MVDKDAKIVWKARKLCTHKDTCSILVFFRSFFSKTYVVQIRDIFSRHVGYMRLGSVDRTKNIFRVAVQVELRQLASAKRQNQFLAEIYEPNETCTHARES